MPASEKTPPDGPLSDRLAFARLDRSANPPRIVCEVNGRFIDPPEFSGWAGGRWPRPGCSPDHPEFRDAALQWLDYHLDPSGAVAAAELMAAASGKYHPPFRDLVQNGVVVAKMCGVPTGRLEEIELSLLREDPDAGRTRLSLSLIRGLVACLAAPADPQSPCPQVACDSDDTNLDVSDAHGPRNEKPRKRRIPSKNTQDDILAAIRDARMPLESRDVRRALGGKGIGSLRHHLAAMTHDLGLLVHIPCQGYWPAGEPPPE